ncbi:hypothetical protein [Streptomyces sparsus]
MSDSWQAARGSREPGRRRDRRPRTAKNGTSVASGSYESRKSARSPRRVTVHKVTDADVRAAFRPVVTR